MSAPARVYLDKAQTIFCVVDAEDYEWAMQWRWRFTMDKRKRKYYATRTTRRRKETPKQIKIYMHKAILAERKGELPPTPAHTIGDHDDGDSLNNRRENLNWATPSENAKNVKPKKRTWLNPITGQLYEWSAPKNHWIGTGRYPLGANPMGLLWG